MGLMQNRREKDVAQEVQLLQQLEKRALDDQIVRKSDIGCWTNARKTIMLWRESRR